MEQRNTQAFIERQAKILQDPLFGDIHDPLTHNRTLKAKSTTDTKLNRFKSKGSSFATTVAMVSGSKEEKSPIKVHVNSSTRETPCSFCAGMHLLAYCQKINVQPHEAKIEFLRENGLCFGCFKAGHMSKNCKRRMKCQSCQAKHPTILHIKRSPKSETYTHKPEQHSMVAKPEETSISSALVTLGEVEGTVAGRECIQAIVPVLVKLCNGSESVPTYAFLDPGSTRP